jgi:hypothetical protein
MPVEAERIRIDDLADHLLTTEKLAMCAPAEGFVVDFGPASILEAARHPTGLDDFGPLDFVERLVVLCRAVDDDTSLHAASRARVHLDLVRPAANGLRIQDVLTRHPPNSPRSRWAR